MTCDACQAAEANPHSGRYRAQCLECAARALSYGPTFFDAAQADALTPDYRDALQSIWGADWKDGHARVKAWAEKRKK